MSASIDVFARLAESTAAHSLAAATERHPASVAAGAPEPPSPRIVAKTWLLALVSVIVVTRDHRKDLEAVLRTLGEWRNGPLEVVVVDDGSSDGTYEWLSHVAVGGVVIRNEKPIGLIDAATLGINASEGEYIGVIDLTERVTPETALPPAVVRRHHYEVMGRYTP